MYSKLKQTRIDLGYTIEEISDALKIRKNYLLALEEDKYDLLPGDAYAMGYLKSYSKFLNIETKTNDSVDVHNRINISTDENKNLKTKQYIIIISILMLTITVTYYIIFYTDNY